jgi:hypothetical protein
MSLLPQRKKSVEEIATLREGFGLAPPEAPPEAPAEMKAPAPLHPGPPVWIPEIPANSPGEKIPQPASPTPEPQPVPAPAKIIRSLRKSEQGPRSATAPPLQASKLPSHRHSADQVQEIRRQEALSQLQLPPHPMTLVAHLALVIPGYLGVLGAAGFGLFYDTEKLHPLITAAGVAVAVVIASYIFFKKPLSHHHAAFIVVMALLVIVFGTLSYFPNLQHGT